jgi:hypothetical protein
MIKFKLPALFLGLIFPYILTGQFSDFDLSKYRLPDIKTNRLNLNFDLYKNGNKDFSQISNLDTTETKHNNLSGSLNLSYYHFRNSENYQGDLMISAYISPQLYRNSWNALMTKENSINTDFLIRSNNIFFNKNMSFVEVNPYFSYYSSNDRYHQDVSSSSTRDDNDAQSTTTISFPVSIGHGRIEPVEDVRLAIYILEELNKVGRISNLPTDNVIIDMAKEISKIKRKRFFDSRIRKIKELQVIDSFLVANDIISSSDMNYFSVLNDQWDYAYGPPRESGFAISAGFDNNVSFNKLYQETIFDNTDPIKSTSIKNVYELGGFFKLRYAKPINLYWQTSGSILTSYNVEFTRDPDHKESVIENFRTNIFRTDLTYSLQFLPNSRTSIKLNIGGSFLSSQGERTLINIDPVDYHYKSNQLTISPGLELYYYISPQLRIQLNSSIYLFNSKSLEIFETQLLDNEHIWNRNQHNISVNLIYSFF